MEIETIIEFDSKDVKVHVEGIRYPFEEICEWKNNRQFER